MPVARQHFTLGQRVRFSPLGLSRFSQALRGAATGTVVGFGYKDPGVVYIRRDSAASSRTRVPYQAADWEPIHRSVHDAGCDYADEIVGQEVTAVIVIDAVTKAERPAVCTCGANDAV